MLRPYGINHPEYNLLMMLYGTESNAMHPTELADAAGENSPTSRDSPTSWPTKV